MKDIRLFTKWICSVLTLLTMLLCMAWLAPKAMAAEVINGKVTFVIEHKDLAPQDAQIYLTNHTAIPLRVSLIFEGGWIDAFAAGKIPGIDASHFAFGIAENATGRDDKSNPLLTSNIPALIYAGADVTSCSLSVPNQPTSMYIRFPGWFVASQCPEFAYSAGFDNSNPFDDKYRDTTIDGKPAKILDLFNIYVQLQTLQSVYIRGIDCNTAGDKMDNTDDETTLITTPGTTILNFLAGTTVYTYPGGPTSAADWTLSGSPKYGGDGKIITQYYGGVIPGGIFIEQVPEVTQFEPSFSAGHSISFCPGDDIVLKGTIKIPQGTTRGDYDYVFGCPSNIDNSSNGLKLEGIANSPVAGSGFMDGVKIEWIGSSSSITSNANVELQVTIQRDKYDALNLDNGVFRLAVYKKGGYIGNSPESENHKDGTVVLAKFPDIYLHVSDELVEGPANEGTYTRVRPDDATPKKPDTIKGIPLNGEFAIRFSCSDPKNHQAWDPCFMSGYDGRTVTMTRLYRDGSVAGTNLAMNRVRTAAKEVYYASFTWDNGCVVESDTIVVVPVRTFDAPLLSIQHNDCPTETTPMSFKMEAKAPAGLSIDRWEWVVRQEACFADYVGSEQMPVVTDPTKVPTDPDERDFFAGGFKMESGQTRTHTYVYFPSGNAFGFPEYSVTYDVRVSDVSANPTGSVLDVGSTCNGVACVDFFKEFNLGSGIGSAWMPAPDADLQPGSTAAMCHGTGVTYDPTHDEFQTPYYNRGTYKRVYVRYHTVDNEISEWANATTPHIERLTDEGIIPSFGEGYKPAEVPDLPIDFSISFTKGSPGPDFAMATYPVASDTTIEANDPVQFFLTTNLPFLYNDILGAALPKFELIADMLWQVSDDDGVTWNTWAVTPAGTDLLTYPTVEFPLQIDDKIPIQAITFIPAPSLRYPSKKEMYRIVHNNTCNMNAADAATNYSQVLTVKMQSNVEPGEIVAWVNNTGVQGPYPMCEEQVDLVLQNYEPGATLKWQKRDNPTDSWQDCSPAVTSATLTYTPPVLASITDDQYKNGIKQYFRVIVSVGSDVVETDEYEVDKYYVVKPTQTVLNPKSITSGICMGEDMILAFNSSKGDHDVTKTLYEATQPNGAFAATSDVALGYDNTMGYIYDKTNKDIDNYSYYLEYERHGCKANSDTVQYKVVDKPKAGTVGPSELCPGQQTNLTYTGTDLGNSFAWGYVKANGSDVTFVSLGTSVSTPYSVVVPEAAVNNDAVDIYVIPAYKRTATNAGGTTDETVCYIGTDENDDDSKIVGNIKVGSNCEFQLKASVTDFCENAIPNSIVILMDAPQEADNATAGDGFTLKFRPSGSSATYVNVPTSYYRVGAMDAATSTYDSLIVYPAFFTSSDGFTGRDAGVEFIVTVKKGGNNLPDPTPVEIVVLAAPKFSNKTIEMIPGAGVCENDDLSFGASVQSSSGTPTYVWYYTNSVADTANGPYTAVSGTDHHVNANELTINTSSANRATLNSRFYGAVITATSNGCTTVDTTAFIQPIINPLPDTAKFVKSLSADAVTVNAPAKTVTISSCSGTSVTLSAETNDGLKDGALKHTDYTYEWSFGGNPLTDGTDGYVIARTGNTGTSCVIPVAKATAGTKTYKLKVTASALKKGGTAGTAADYGCPRTVELTFNVKYSDCKRDKIIDGNGVLHTKTDAFAFCEVGEVTGWPKVGVTPAELPAATSGNAPVTKITLYHIAAAADGSIGTADVSVKTWEITPPTPTPNVTAFDVKTSGKDFLTSVGSHYYYAKVERTGYSPTYTDTVEYVIGAMPSITMAADAGVFLSTDNPSDPDFTPSNDRTLTVCAGTEVYLQTREWPGQGSDPNNNTEPDETNNVSYYWFHSTSAVTTPLPEALTPPTSGRLGTSKINAWGVGKTAETNKGYYYVYRTYKRTTPIYSSPSNALQTCKKSFPVPQVGQLTVNPMPNLPKKMTPTQATINVCENVTFDLDATLSATAPTVANTTWSYRWFKKRGSGADEAYDPAYSGTDFGKGAAAVPSDGHITKTGVSASVPAGTTGTVTDVYKLKVYAKTTEGCYDSTALLSGITVNITPLPTFTTPTITMNPTDGAICEGKTATLSITAPSVSGATLAYQWYKCKNGTTQDPTTDDPVGTGTSYTTPATADAAGNYYVRITATTTGGTACPTNVNTAVAKVTVKSLPTPVFVQWVDGTTGTEITVCKGDKPALKIGPDATTAAKGYSYKYTWPTASVDNFNPNDDGSGNVSTTGASESKVKASVTGSVTSAGSPKQITVSIVTSKDGCSATASKTFKVNVSACDKDQVQDGKGAVHSKTVPFSVCAGEAAAAWPKVKIVGQNMAGRTITQMELKHRYGTSGEYATVANSTPNAASSNLEFEPATATVNGQDLKKAGSHYYYAVVTRTAGGSSSQVLRTDTVEYVVGAMPDPAVVNGGSIVVSLDNMTPQAKDGNSLTLCAGPNTYLYTKGLPTLATASPNTTYDGATWYKSTAQTSISPIPAEPSAAMTKVGDGTQGANDQYDLGATSGVTSATQTDYYYAYLAFSRKTAINSVPGTNWVCDTVYPLASEGVRIVNPMPEMTISMDAQSKSVCDGASVTLDPVNLTAKPTGDTWTYRWFKDGKSFAPAYPDAAATTASHTFTASNTTTSPVDEVYTLKVYAETGKGCPDSVLLTNSITVRVAPQPTANPSVPVIEPAGDYATKADGEIYVCEGNTMKLQLETPFTTVPSGSEYVKYHWYKVDGGTETKLESGNVYTTVDESLNYLNITKAQETDATNGVNVAGDYKLVVRVSVNTSCYKDFTSDPITLGFGKRPVLQVTASTAKEFTLCPGEETTFGVQLDATTQAEVTSGKVQIAYQWYKDGQAEANKIDGATLDQLTVKADDLPAGKYKYYVKITKNTPDAYNCPTEIWSDMAVSMDATKNGGMGVPFELTRRASCSKDEIVEGGSTNPPVMAKDVASAICLSDAETGKMFRIKASDGRLSINKVSWHYAQVTENGTRLVMGAIKDGPVCNDEIKSGNIGCAFNTNTVADMKGVGEWRIWADIERPGANPCSTDTIHFVVRPNPTLTNEDALKVVLLQIGTGTEIDPAFVCDYTKARLAETPDPAMDGLADLIHEERTDSVGYDWLNVTTGGTGGIQKSTDKVWEIQLSQRKAAPASYDAPTPAGAAYQDDYTLTQIYQRRYQRNTAAYPHAGLPTYNIACKVMDGTAVKRKVLRKTTYASVKPKGTVTDAAAKEKADYCTSGDLSTPLALTFNPAAGDQYKAAQVTVWKYASSDNGAAWVNEGPWATVTDGTAQAAANQLSVSLTDGRLNQPASGKTMAYKFWAQVQNGQCEDSVGGYVLTFYGAPVAGGLEVPQTMCADGATFTVKATKVKPANAEVTFYAYDGDPTTGSPTLLVTKPIPASGSGDEADVMWTASADIPDLKAGRYYFRYKVADPNKVCTEVWSGVKSLDLAPNPTLTGVTLDKTQLCLENGAQVTLTFNATDVEALKIYASDVNLASGVQDILDAVANGTAKEIHAATDAEVSAKSVTLTYDGNNMYVNPSKGANSLTYFYAIGTQDKSGSLTGACASTSAKVTLKTGKPVTNVTIEWSDETEAAKKVNLGPVELGTIHRIDLSGGANGDKKTLYSDATDKNDPARWSTVPSAYPYNFTATPVGKLYVWAVVTGYNGCPSKTSASIEAEVVQSDQYSVKGEQDVCAEGDIELSIDKASANVGIAATPHPVKWLYKSQSASAFTDVPATATVGDEAADYKLTWPSALSTAGTYVFRMAYTNATTNNPDTTHPYTVTVHAKPTLSNTAAPLNLPHPICDGESFDIKLASGVTMSDKLDLLFSQDAAEADLTKWTTVAQDKGATFTYPVDGLSDSGYYRVRVYSDASCDPMVSDPQLLAVNSKPVAGTLALTPGTACFGTPVDVALTGYTGRIEAYEYTADRVAADNATAPAAPADNEMAWRPVTAAPATYPIDIPAGFGPDADGNYPATWTLTSVKHGYKLRAKVTNGACPEAYASTLVKIYDTVVVDQAPQSVTVNENAQHFPAKDITFTSTGKWRGGKYKDGNTFETPPSAMKYQWRYRWDESKPWENFSGNGVVGLTSTTLTIQPAYWTDNGKIDPNLVKTVQFRMLIVSGDCEDTIRSTEAKINLQTPLTAGEIEVPVKNPSDQFNGKCFFYRDTVILHHKGASGQGTVRHHWMVGPTVDKGVLQTLDQAGFAYHYGRDDKGNEDRTTVYLTGKDKAPAELQHWWDENGEFRKFIHVIVTDDVHKEADLFNADGSLKANPDPKHYADWEMCFRTKPTWEFPNDTICDNETTVTLSLTSDVKLEETTPHIHMTVLRIATYRKEIASDEWAYLNVVAINHPDKKDAPKETSLVLPSGESIKMALLEKTVVEDGNTLTLPTGELVITAENPNDRIGEAFDSLAIRVIVETNLSQKYDTLYSVLRIDKGVKAIKPKLAEVTVCEGGTAELEAAIERYSASIPSKIKWKWYRRGTAGDPGTDTDDGLTADRFTGSTTKGVPDPVKLTFSNVQPTDSGIWVLKTETECGGSKEQEFVLKVNVKPTWEENLTIDKTEICAGPDALTLKAKLNVNWTPDITWEHAKTATGPWTEVTQDGTMSFDQTPAPGQLGVSLKIEPTYMRDSGYYRVKVTAPADAACAGFEMASVVKYVHIDTTPQITLDKSKWELSRGAKSDLTATISNPKPKTANKICTESANTSTMVWRVLYTEGLKKGQPYKPSVTRADFLDTPEGLSLGSIFKMEGLFGNDDGSTAVLKLDSVPLGLDSVSVFLHVDNCCGESYSDTILIRVVDNLALFGTTGDIVCEGATARLTASANMNIDDPGMRAWEYTTGEGDDNWQEVPMDAWQATEDMKNSVSTLTIPNVPYSRDGYRFRFKVTDGAPKYSDPAATLVVRPVNDLHVLVLANPNPASDYPGFDKTTLEATVYVGDAPKDNKLPDNARVLDEEALKLYGYTVFDWYQIAPGKVAQADLKRVNTPGAKPFETDAAGDALHAAKLEVKNLKYEDHDSTYYFAILRSACFETSEWANQQDGTSFDGRHSDTTVLRIYEDLIVEWTAESMYSDTLPYGTTPEELATWNWTHGDPTDKVIGVHLENRNPENPETLKHWISSAYYITCGANVSANLAVELRKGVQSNDDDLMIATRQWFYRKDPGDAWTAMVTDKRFGGMEDPDFGEIFDMQDGRRDLKLSDIIYDMNGWQFFSVALADSIGKNADGLAIYQFADTTPVLTLVVSEPIPSNLAFEPDPNAGAPYCGNHDYTFTLSAQHESYLYQWQIKRPGVADYEPIAELDGQAEYAFGVATPADNGTMVRAIVSNYCGSDTVEAEIQIMDPLVVAVELSSDTAFCVGGAAFLTATATNAGDNPTYAWLVNGEPVPGATSETYLFDPAAFPALAAGGTAQIVVRLTADPALCVVEPTVSDTATVTVHPLPSGGELTLSVTPSTVTVVDSATLSVGVEEGCTVAWRPEEWLHDATSAETSTRPIPTSGQYWFYATVTSEHGCSVTDSVQLTVSSSFEYDSTGVVVVVPPLLPWLDGDGNEPIDTTLQIVVIGDTLRIKACENSIAFVTLFSSGGDPTLVYEWEGVEPLTAEELAAYGYYEPLPDSVFALMLDGELTECGCTITERDGEGLSVHMQMYVAYYLTQHVALEAIPTMRHNRYYENQVVFFTAHPNRFSWYHFYDYNPADAENVLSQHGAKNLYKTDYVYKEGAERTVYVSVADGNGCRSYDSVDINVLPLPNAMVLNDPNYPEANILFPEFEVEIHDSWGRLVKAMDDGLGWNGERGGKQVEGGTYYYRVKLPTVDGFTYVKGAVTVFTKKK